MRLALCSIVMMLAIPLVPPATSIGPVDTVTSVAMGDFGVCFVSSDGNAGTITCSDPSTQSSFPGGNYFAIRSTGEGVVCAGDSASSAIICNNGEVVFAPPFAGSTLVDFDVSRSVMGGGAGGLCAIYANGVLRCSGTWWNAWGLEWDEEFQVDKEFAPIGATEVSMGTLSICFRTGGWECRAKVSYMNAYVKTTSTTPIADIEAEQDGEYCVRTVQGSHMVCGDPWTSSVYESTVLDMVAGPDYAWYNYGSGRCHLRQSYDADVGARIASCPEAGWSHAPWPGFSVDPTAASIESDGDGNICVITSAAALKCYRPGGALYYQYP